jgi:response regulator RpfG family c-di-GMP phosphodiesterase
MTATRKPRVLCVDDEPMVLEGLVLHLRTRFEVLTAPGGEQGLEMLKYNGPFAVVVSDMRMPGMSGAEFLAQARQQAPDTVRMLLTGYADLDSAVAAINQGNVFRFLSKPCPAPILVQALTAAVEQYRLVQSERVLLEQTLAGSIRTMVEVLSLAHPVAFGRAVRLKRLVSGLCDRLEVERRWDIEAAAQLSQLGCVNLPAEVAEKLYFGRDLTASEQALAERLPAIADQLLANIPRLEPVREILSLQGLRFDGADATWGQPRGETLPLGARMLRLAVDYDRLEAGGASSAAALGTLAAREGVYDPALLEALKAAVGGRAQEVRELPLAGVRPGMVLAEDVRAQNGMLLVARGHNLTQSLLDRLKNLQVREPVRVVAEG